MTQLANKGIRIAITGEGVEVWRATPEPGTDIDAIEVPSYWAHVSSKLRPGAKIEVLPTDMSFFAEYLVVDAGKLYAKVQRLNYRVFFTEDKSKVPEGYELKHRGPQGWCVLRGKDVIAEKQGTKEAAAKWLETHLQAA